MIYQNNDPSLAKDEALYDRLLADIASGLFVSGQRLKINELAKRYNSSSTPVREALRQLQGEGIIEITQNRGAAVRTVDTNTVRDIHEVLQMLEPYFCGWFAEFHTQKQIDELEEVQELIDALQLDENAKQNYRDLDSRFHSIIYSGHYNKRALLLWQNLRRGLHIFTFKLPLSNPRLKAGRAEHHTLIKAIKSSDAEAARNAQSRHIAQAGEVLYKQLRALENR